MSDPPSDKPPRKKARPFRDFTGHEFSGRRVIGRENSHWIVECLSCHAKAKLGRSMLEKEPPCGYCVGFGPRPQFDFVGVEFSGRRVIARGRRGWLAECLSCHDIAEVTRETIEKGRSCRECVFRDKSKKSICLDCGGPRNVPIRGESRMYPRCRSCENKRGMERYFADHERQKKRLREWARNRYQSSPEYRLHLRDVARDRYKKNPEPFRQAQRKRAIRIRNCDGSHTEDEWLACLEMHRNRCAYCDVGSYTTKLTRDHVIPVSRGGSDYIWNIVPACRSCNSSKNNRDKPMLPEHEEIWLARQPKNVAQKK